MGRQGHHGSSEVIRAPQRPQVPCLGETLEKAQDGLHMQLLRADAEAPREVGCLHVAACQAFGGVVQGRQVVRDGLRAAVDEKGPAAHLEQQLLVLPVRSFGKALAMRLRRDCEWARGPGSLDTDRREAKHMGGEAQGARGSRATDVVHALGSHSGVGETHMIMNDAGKISSKTVQAEAKARLASWAPWGLMMT